METATKDLKDINKVPMLIGAQHYREWANVVKTHLLRENAWAVVEGTLVKPVQPQTGKATRSKDSESAVATEEQALKEYRTELKEWSIICEQQGTWGNSLWFIGKYSGRRG
jgi:hypothetical protein